MSSSESDKFRSEIKKIGIEINDVYDLVNSRQSYRSAIPVLMNFLRSGVQDMTLREGIVRALGAKEARGTEAGKLLIEEFWKMPKDDKILRWTIGNTISIIADDSLFDEISKIVRDTTNGQSREMFVVSLERIKSPRAEKLLIEMLDDDDVVAHALHPLGKKKSVRAREKIVLLTKHSRTLVRNEAVKALKRIDKV